jgi:DNA topoisomerase VI subunit B
MQLTISDNGQGIPPKTVSKVLDFDVRVSDKAAYRSPTRGAQGNALKTVVGIPYALGCHEPVVIEAQDVRHEIRAWVDPAGELRVTHEPASGAALQDGTRASLYLPIEGQVFDPDFWARSFALFNPHATVNYVRRGLSYQGNSGGSETEEIYKSSVGSDWRKFLPTDLTSPYWYAPATLRKLVFAHIADHSRGGRDLPLGEFVRQFRGLSSPKKAKAVRAAMNGLGHLSDFEYEPEEVDALLGTMREQSKAPSHNVLGVVGEDHFRESFEAAYEVREFTYKRVKEYFPSGLPYVFEFALATLRENEPGHLYTGINFSPTFDDPLEGTALAGPKFKANGIRGFLSLGHALPASDRTWYHSPTNVAVAAHIITPAPVFLDRGKTRLQMEEDRGEEEE